MPRSMLILSAKFLQHKLSKPELNLPKHKSDPSFSFLLSVDFKKKYNFLSWLVYRCIKASWVQSFLDISVEAAQIDHQEVL